MAASPWTSLQPTLEFRAPPPSPVAGAHCHGHVSPENVINLDGFLSQTLRVPKLCLPLRIFPQEPTPWNPPEIDFWRLASPGSDGGSTVKLLKSTVSAFGCFELVNHGIPRGLIAAARDAAISAFRIPPDEGLLAARISPERRWGFKVDEEREGEELLLWAGTGMRNEEELARIWPERDFDFCDKLESLILKIEKIACKIGELLLEEVHQGGIGLSKFGRLEGTTDGSILSFHKHRQSKADDGGMKNELLRMLMRRSRSCSYSLTLHVDCGELSEFHVYSRRGWFRFRQNNAAIIVTIGSHIQACSGGFYKQVVGKPALRNTGDEQDCVSVALHYCYNPPDVAGPSVPVSTVKERTISIAEQVMVASCLVLLYHLVVFFHCGF